MATLWRLARRRAYAYYGHYFGSGATSTSVWLWGTAVHLGRDPPRQVVEECGTVEVAVLFAMLADLVWD